MAFTETTKFFDWTSYDMADLASSQTRYTKSMVWSGFDITSTDILGGGSAVVGGLDIDLAGTFDLGSVLDGYYIYLKTTITLGQFNNTTGVATPGYTTTTIHTTSDGGLNDLGRTTKYLKLYKKVDADTFTDLRVGRTDTVNGIGANGTNNVLITASNIPATNPGTGDGDTIQEILQELENADEEIYIDQATQDARLDSLEATDIIHDSRLDIIDNMIGEIVSTAQLNSKKDPDGEVSTVGVKDYNLYDYRDDPQQNYQPLFMDWTGAAEKNAVELKSAGTYELAFFFDCINDTAADVTVKFHTFVNDVAYQTWIKTIPADGSIQSINQIGSYMKSDDTQEQLSFKYEFLTAGVEIVASGMDFMLITGDMISGTYIDSDHVIMEGSDYNGASLTTAIDDLDDRLEVTEGSLVNGNARDASGNYDVNEVTAPFNVFDSGYTGNYVAKTVRGADYGANYIYNTDNSNFSYWASYDDSTTKLYLPNADIVSSRNNVPNYAIVEEMGIVHNFENLGLNNASVEGKSLEALLKEISDLAIAKHDVMNNVITVSQNVNGASEVEFAYPSFAQAVETYINSKPEWLNVDIVTGRFDMDIAFYAKATNSTHCFCSFRIAGGKVYKWNFYISGGETVTMSKLTNEKGEYGDNFLTNSKDIVKIYDASYYMYNGQPQLNFSIPANCRVTEIECIYADYNSETTEKNMTQMNKTSIGQGTFKLGTTNYDHLTSGQYDVMEWIATGSDAFNPASMSSMSYNVKVNYSALRLELLPLSNNNLEQNPAYRDLVLGEVIIKGHYVPSQPTALGTHMEINDITMEEAITQLLAKGISQEQLDIEESIVTAQLLND